jgi:hypothetical protein
VSRFPVSVPRGTRLPRVVDHQGDSIHVFGDTHFEVPQTYYDQSKAPIAAKDANRMIGKGSLVAWGQAGDATSFAATAEITAFKAWWNSLDRETLPSTLVPGNHDLMGMNGTGVPDIYTPTQWATSMSEFGVTGKHYYKDVGRNLRVLCLAPTDNVTTGAGATYRCTVDAAGLAWCDARMDETTRNCIIMFHAPLRDTVNKAPANATYLSSSDADWYAHDNPDYTIATMIAKHPNLKAWVSGHLHSPVATPFMATPKTYGSVTVAAVSASTTVPIPYAYGVPDIVSTRVTVYSNKVVVRYRDHGLGQWIDPAITVAL